MIRFERTLETIVCTTSGGGDTGMGDGGTLWNGESGRVVMKGEVNMQIGGVDSGVSLVCGAMLEVQPLPSRLHNPWASFFSS